MEITNRREFLATAATAQLAVTSIQASPAEAAADAVSKPLSVAVIGCGGMGRSHLATLAGREDVQVTWVCDVDREAC